jgi:signal transduction histidine kinase
VRARELEIRVQDDGRGAAQNALLSGHGVQGMRERVEALGGVFEAVSLGTSGFQVSATIPLPRSAS